MKFEWAIGEASQGPGSATIYNQVLDFFSPLRIAPQMGYAFRVDGNVDKVETR